MSIDEVRNTPGLQLTIEPEPRIQPASSLIPRRKFHQEDRISISPGTSGLPPATVAARTYRTSIVTEDGGVTDFRSVRKAYEETSGAPTGLVLDIFV